MNIVERKKADFKMTEVISKIKKSIVKDSADLELKYISYFPLNC